MTSRRPLTVAISGTSGSGKSTLVAALAESYAAEGRAVATVAFDDHLTIELADVRAWLDAGGDPDGWRTDTMVDRLTELRSSPEMAGGVIVVEEPFGRTRSAIDPLLDVVVHLDVGLHVALARRMLRDFVPPTGTLSEDQRAEARTYLTTYVDVQARAYAHLAVLARASSDLRLDGEQDLAVTLGAVRTAVAALGATGTSESTQPTGAGSVTPDARGRLGKHSRPVPEGRAFFLTATLWKLADALPVHQVPLNSLPDLDQDCWFDGRPATIRAVADHARRINEADRSYPIILAADGTLMDGGHRLAQASLRGDATIAAVRFEVDPEPDWIQPR